MHAPGASGELVADDAVTVEGKRPQPTDEVVYYMLAAELAGQRGELDVALDNYLKASALTQDTKILQRATQIALYLKKPDKALEATTLWQQREPDNVEARRLSALLLLKAERLDEALEQLAALLKMPGVDVENTMIDLVKVLSADVSKEDGAHFMRRLVERFPKMAELHFATALLAADKGDYPQALAETEKALAQHPDWSRARLLQAQVMSRMGNSQKARDVMQKALKSDPNNARLRLIYSQFLAKAGDVRGAEKELARILAKDPSNEDAMMGLAMAQMETGQEAKAKQLFGRLAESPNRRAQACFYLGIIESRKANWQTALQWFDKASDGSVAFDAKVSAINALIQLDRIPEARARLADIRTQYPQEALRMYLLEAELLTKTKDYPGAFALLSQALEALPGKAELLYTRALVAEELGKTEAMEADLRAVLEKNPDDANALNALGFTLADRSERLEEAKRHIARALELKPGDPAILDSYGWVSYRLGDYPTAKEYLGRAYALVKDPEIGAHLGEVLWESGNQQEAKKIWAECLRKDPEHKDMKKVIARYPEAFK
ncbi:MAG: tetratricopeptide repeat protein [Candidatus Methylumidiphilus sp.]